VDERVATVAHSDLVGQHRAAALGPKHEVVGVQPSPLPAARVLAALAVPTQYVPRQTGAVWGIGLASRQRLRSDLFLGSDSDALCVELHLGNALRAYADLTLLGLHRGPTAVGTGVIHDQLRRLTSTLAAT